MKTFDLNLLRVLDAVLSTGSVTAAAERLHLSVPATSHALSRLRAAVGDPLLVRAGRQLVPTPRAIELREPVAQLLAQSQLIVTPTTAPKLASTRRNFVIRAPSGIDIGFGAAMVKALRQAMPLATLTFVPESLDDPSALRHGRVDLDIGHFNPAEPEVVRAELRRQKFVAAVREGHELSQRPLTARRYAASLHVSAQGRLGAASPVDDALAELGLARDVSLTVPQSYAAAIVAARSDLVATLGERVARAIAPALHLRLLPLPFVPTPESMLVAWHPRQSTDPAHTLLRKTVLALLADDSNGGSAKQGK